jgi:hypothetical protein
MALARKLVERGVLPQIAYPLSIIWPLRIYMAQVQLEPIMEHLRAEMRRALGVAVREVIKDAKFDESALYLAFRRAVRSRCKVWERVPDKYIITD